MSSCSHFPQSTSETPAQQAAEPWRSWTKWQAAPPHSGHWCNWQYKTELFKTLPLCHEFTIRKTVLWHPLRSQQLHIEEHYGTACLLLYPGWRWEYRQCITPQRRPLLCFHWCSEDFLLTCDKCYSRCLWELFSPIFWDERTKLPLLTWRGTVTCCTQISTAHLYEPTSTLISRAVLTHSSTALKAYRRQWFLTAPHICKTKIKDLPTESEKGTRSPLRTDSYHRRKNSRVPTSH